MGYPTTKAACQCDFCWSEVAIDLDGTLVSGKHISGKDITEAKVAEHYADLGGFYVDGDVYACKACIDRALAAIEERYGDRTMEMLGKPGIVYQWMDTNIHGKTAI